MLGWLIALSIVGILDSAWLLYVHLTGSTQGCQVTETVNCSLLQLHTYSEWFDIPIPVFSMLFYVFVLIVALRVKKEKPQDPTRPIVYLFLLSLLSILSTIYMASISYFVLKTLCPFCFVLYVVSIGFFVVTFLPFRRLQNPWGYLVRYDVKRAHHSPWFIWPAIVMIVTLVVGHQVFRDRAEVQSAANKIDTETTRMLGSPDAAVTITTFSDFECPHCRLAAEMFHELVSQMQGRVKVVYKFYPLDRTCNPAGGMHQHSCAAARAAYCASVQEKFWPFHDLVYANQTQLSDGSFFQFAQSLQLDVREFENCWKNAGSLAPVEKDIGQGNQLGVQGTPAIYLNGRKYTGPITLSALKTAISDL
jgi:protein-disulfide isomerase/uncharacterized membrane protein